MDHQKNEKHAAEWENIFAKDTSDKRWLFKTDKGFLKLSRKTKSPVKKMGPKPHQR